MKDVYLLANAHIDPVWQWGLDEGIACSIATFRSAANILEENDNFLFCHNEAVLYRWVKEYDPPLYERIKRLVKAGRWCIMGGFELQPDCVMPSGEAMVRQILSGREFFLKEFGVEPNVAVSMDCFGHSRGMVQILKKCGYGGYIFLRSHMPTPEDFIWKGFDGSEIIAHRLQVPYGTPLGNAVGRLDEFVKSRTEEYGLFPWGVGNHGGGPSRKDLNDLNAYKGANVHHATAENYIKLIEKRKDELPIIDKSIMPFNVGGYTSIMNIKKKYRELENALVMAEKIALSAYANDMSEYPKEELGKAWQALLFLQFHDVLPGTITKPVVDRMLERAGYGLEIAKNILTKAFFRLSESEKLAEPGEIPILVYNPHPYPIKRRVECEFMLADQNWDANTMTLAEIHSAEGALPSQMRKEDSSLNLDWRKRVAFEATLAPMCLNRYKAVLTVVKAETIIPEQNFELKNEFITARISEETGLIEDFSYKGVRLTENTLGQILLYEDNADPWHMTEDDIGKNPIPLVLSKKPCVVSDGDVLKEIYCEFALDGVRAEVTYTLEKNSPKLGIRVKMCSINQSKAYRMVFDMLDKDTEILGEMMYGLERDYDDGTENSSQKFDLLRGKHFSLGVINNGIYSGCYKNGKLEKTLMRAPVYCAHPIDGRPLIKEGVLYDYDGIGQYECMFTIMPVERENECAIAREAALVNEPPVSVNVFPSETRKDVPFKAQLSGNVILSCMKAAENGNGMIARFYEPVGNTAPFCLTVGEAKCEDTLSPFEVRTYRIFDGMITEESFLS